MPSQEPYNAFDCLVGVIYSFANLSTTFHFFYHPLFAHKYRTGSHYGC